ncbi:MAG: DUF1841 family protein [Gammaproteobacteria bacterium]
MFIEDREGARRMFVEAWRKYCARMPMEPLEVLIADVVQVHPEYHGWLVDDTEALQREFIPEGGQSNPFLHMGMHIALREQVGSDRPAGIAELYRRAVWGASDSHGIEHEMMECLAEALWRAQRENRLPDETAYLECLRRRLS